MPLACQRLNPRRPVSVCRGETEDVKMIHPSRTTRSRRPTSCDFALSLPIHLPWKFAASSSRAAEGTALPPLSRLSQRRLARVTHSQINLALARPRLSLSHSPSLAPIAVLALFTDVDDGGVGRADGRWSRRAAKSTEFHVFHVVWLPPSLPANPPPLHARACYVHSRSQDLRKGGGGGDPRG